MDYTLAVGTHDPSGFEAPTDMDAIRQAAAYIESRHADDLRGNAQEVVTLMGPNGLVTRPSERLDEFVQRVTGVSPVGDPERMQTGDTNALDCNGD